MEMKHNDLKTLYCHNCKQSIKPGIAENDKTFSSEIEFFTRFFVKSIKKKNVKKRINEGGN